VLKKLILIFLLVFLGGCAGSPTPAPDQVVFGQPPLPPTEGPTLSPIEGVEPPDAHVLRVWVPPEFDPASGTEAAQIFLARLEEFSVLYPDIQVEVRVKASVGPGGMLDSLSATQAVAPESLPDLVALPRPVLETAAIRGLIFPLDRLAAVQEDTDWYNFAHQLARVENTVYGLPFACDALVLLYRTQVVVQPPRDWTTTKQLGLPLLFPIGSSQSLFTLALYQAAGGNVEDAQGLPTITPATLSAVFDFYMGTQEAGILSPAWVKYRTEEETFVAYQNGEADMTIAWVSAYWTRAGEDTASGALPTPGGVPFAPLTGWAWAISNPNSTHQDLSTALAQFLTESNYLSEWILAAGYLPPRPSVLAAWPESSKSALASRLVLSAQLIPSVDVLNTLGPLIQQATLDVLNGQQTPAQAAQSVASRLGGP
jgi:multiple sugar transport system substrate-binding protein